MKEESVSAHKLDDMPLILSLAGCVAGLCRNWPVRDHMARVL